MDANQIEKMKALALAAGDWAPPEPWEDDRNYSDREIRGLEFCAAANPAAVLELIAEIERLCGSRNGKLVKAYNRHTCVECGQVINREEVYYRGPCSIPGKVSQAAPFHVKCRPTEVAAIAAHTKAGKDNA